LLDSFQVAGSTSDDGVEPWTDDCIGATNLEFKMFSFIMDV
jgi:hypothetical protein